MAYAQGTTITVERSLSEIAAMLRKSGALRIMQMQDDERFAIQFQKDDRLIRFIVQLPSLNDIPQRDGRGSVLPPQKRRERQEQAARQKARALFLVIKAKLEACASGIESFEEAFLANVVMGDDRTLYASARAAIAQAYQSGKVARFLLPPPGL